jgi:hypothetical protein
MGMGMGVVAGMGSRVVSPEFSNSGVGIGMSNLGMGRMDVGVGRMDMGVGVGGRVSSPGVFEQAHAQMQAQARERERDQAHAGANAYANGNANGNGSMGGLSAHPGAGTNGVGVLSYAQVHPVNRRERSGPMGGGSFVNVGVVGVDSGRAQHGPVKIARAGELEVELEGEEGPKIEVNLGTYVFPRTPFPYFFPVDYAFVGLGGDKEGRERGEDDKGHGEEEKENQDKSKSIGTGKQNGKEGESAKGKASGAAGLDRDADMVMGIAAPDPETRKTDERKAKEQEREKEPSASSSLERETRVTIIIPSKHLPLAKPTRPRIWGGGLPPVHSQGQGRPLRLRRIYTDDSDVFLCALHSGWVTWSGARRAKEEGRDLRVEVRVVGCWARAGAAGVRGRESVVGRFFGGWGERFAEREKGEFMIERSDEDDDGRGLISAAWGGGHDGSGIEVLRAEFLEVCSFGCMLVAIVGLMSFLL